MSATESQHQSGRNSYQRFYKMIQTWPELDISASLSEVICVLKLCMKMASTASKGAIINRFLIDVKSTLLVGWHI